MVEEVFEVKVDGVLVWGSDKSVDMYVFVVVILKCLFFISNFDDIICGVDGL